MITWAGCLSGAYVVRFTIHTQPASDAHVIPCLVKMPIAAAGRVLLQTAGYHVTPVMNVMTGDDEEADCNLMTAV